MIKGKGRTLKVDITPYHILDVMADPAYMPFFVRRYHIEMEKAIARGKARPWWSYYYENNPKLLYDDCVEEIKTILGMQQSSASATKFISTVRDIALSACSDWITEKTGRTPEFEIFDNIVKSAQINLKHYGHYIADQKRKQEARKTRSDLDLGHTGKSPVRKESDRGDEASDVLR